MMRKISSRLYSSRPPDEAHYLFKLDFFLLSSVMLGYLIKTLNAGNITTLYVNGMAEYFQMRDTNQFQLAQMWFFVGYLLGGFPSKLVLTRVKVRYYLGVLEILWSLLTFSLCYCTSVNQIYAVRFLVGFLELGFFPSIVYMIGTFYNGGELSKRQLLFNISGTIGSILTGPLQQLILDKKWTFHGRLQEFQMLFFLDLLISFPIAIYTIAVNPGLPDAKNLEGLWYLDDQDRTVAYHRVVQSKTSSQVQYLNKASDLQEITIEADDENLTWKSYFRTWHVVVFPLLFACIGNSSYLSNLIVSTSWIKYDLELPPKFYNTFPSIVNAASLVITLAISNWNDKHSGSLTALLLKSFFAIYIVTALLLSFWEIPLFLHWGCLILLGSVSYASVVMYSWINRCMALQTHHRHFTLVLTNSFDYVIYAFYPIWAWDTRDQPKFRKGFVSAAVLALAGLILTMIADHFIKRDEILAEDDETRGLLESVDEI